MKVCGVKVMLQMGDLQQLWVMLLIENLQWDCVKGRNIFVILMLLLADSLSIIHIFQNGLSNDLCGLFPEPDSRFGKRLWHSFSLVLDDITVYITWAFRDLWTRMDFLSCRGSFPLNIYTCIRHLLRKAFNQMWRISFFLFLTQILIPELPALGPIARTDPTPLHLKTKLIYLTAALYSPSMEVMVAIVVWPLKNKCRII